MDSHSPSDIPATAGSARTPKRHRRWLRRLGWATLWIVTLYALFVVVENWRGRRAWNAYVAEMKTVGEPLDAEAIIPPPIPDVENFAMAPLFKPLFDYERDTKTGEIRWRDAAAKEALDQIEPRGPNNRSQPNTGSWIRGEFTNFTALQEHYRALPDFPKNPDPGEPARDVLVALSKYDEQLAMLREAAARPKSRFPIRYEDHVHAAMPHISVLRQLAILTQLRASAELSLGEAERAFEDLRLTFRLAESIESEPTLLALFVHAAMVHVALQPLCEGVARHQWKDDQLRELQSALARINMGEAYQRALRGERQFFAFGALDSLRKGPWARSKIAALGATPSVPKATLTWLAPQGWIDQNKVSMGRLHQAAISSVETEPVRFHRELSEQFIRDLDSHKSPLQYIYAYFARMVAPLAGTQMVARHQGLIDLSLVAVMLERHYLRHQEYPESLAGLDEDLRATPRGVPPDCVTGNPPHYALQPEGTYALYYEGWNGTDDGGQLGREKEGSDSLDLSKGDWVWPQPARR